MEGDAPRDIMVGDLSWSAGNVDLVTRAEQIMEEVVNEGANYVELVPISAAPLSHLPMTTAAGSSQCSLGATSSAPAGLSHLPLTAPPTPQLSRASGTGSTPSYLTLGGCLPTPSPALALPPLHVGQIQDAGGLDYRGSEGEGVVFDTTGTLEVVNMALTEGSGVPAPAATQVVMETQQTGAGLQLVLDEAETSVLVVPEDGVHTGNGSQDGSVLGGGQTKRSEMSTSATSSDLLNSTATLQGVDSGGGGCGEAGRGVQARPFQCSQCPKSFSQLTRLQEHQRFHSNERPFHCQHCPKRFRLQATLTRHLAAKHEGLLQDSGSSESQAGGAGDSVPPCSACGARFDSQRRLLQHRQEVHAAPKPHVCGVCGKGFNVLEYLQRHLTTHDYEDDENAGNGFPCRLCDQRFLHALGLHKHMQEVHFGDRPHVCPYCNKRFRLATELQSHVYFHATDKKFDCEVCQKGFINEEMLQKHRHLHEAPPDCACEVCQGGDEGILAPPPSPLPPKSLASTQARHKARGRGKGHQCTRCQKVFGKLSSLTTHMRTHTGDRPYHCSICSKSFSVYCTLKRHMVVHTNNRPYTCETCGKGFSEQRYLINHQASHTGQKLYPCDVCGRRFSHSNSLQRHKRDHTDGARPFTCQECGKTFAKQTSLQSHLYVHTGQKPFPCSVCGKAFCLLTTLRSHMASHSGHTPFVCEVCGLAYGQEKSLKAHMRLHTAKKAYACEVCGARFTRESSLTSHMRQHTKEKPFACTQCTKAFRQRTDLVSHMNVHSGSKPFICHVCGNGFCSNGTLRKHVRTHSVEERETTCILCGRQCSTSASLQKHLKVHGGDTETLQACSLLLGISS